MAGKLYVVATPIGNLGDMTGRAVEVLRGCDIIAAEDTQNSINLLRRFDIRARLVSNHKFNEKSACDRLVREVLDGRSVAIISDAGTPCISDPGGVLVREAVRQGIGVEGIPGACAAVTAISISGFDARAFSFAGFFPRESGEINKLLDRLAPGVHVLYESPKRVIKTLEALCGHLPGAQVCLCNDLTKKFERIYRGAPSQVLAELRANPSAEKGEYTLVLEIAGGPDAGAPPAAPGLSIEALLVDVMLKHGCTLKAAVKIAAAEHSLSKNELYAASLEIKKLILRQDTP